MADNIKRQADNKNDDESVVRLEVDASSLKEAFDNIAEGFTNHGTAIRRLRFFQGILATSLVGTNVVVGIALFVR